MSSPNPNSTLQTPSPFPQTHTILPLSGIHTHTAVLLHGHSWTGPRFAERMFALRPSPGIVLDSHSRSDPSILSLQTLFPTVKFVLPSAQILYSKRQDASVSSWFDASSYSDMRIDQGLQIPGLATSVRHVLRVIEEEVRLVGGDASRVVLGGWSQGAATGLWTLLCGAATGYGRSENEAGDKGDLVGALGGFFGIGAWMSFIDEVHNLVHENVEEDEVGFETERNAIEGVGFLRAKIDLSGGVDAVAGEKLAATPVLLGHGSDDAIVPVRLGRKIRDVLRKMGIKVEWQEFSGAPDQGHWVKEPEQFDGIVEFLREFVQKSGETRRQPSFHL